MAIEAHRVAGRMRGSANIALRNQLVRAAMSVPANIVEGRQQKSEADFRRFLGYAISSLSELEYHLMIAKDVDAISHKDFVTLTVQVKSIRAMSHGLLKKLQPAAGSRKAGSR